MKLRLSENCLRFRLGQREVQLLGDGGTLEQKIPLLPKELTFRLECGPRDAATFDGQILKVCVDRERARRWAQSNTVALEATADGAGAPVAILIEKDFKCLHGELSGQEDCFPNPAESAMRSA